MIPHLGYFICIYMSGGLVTTVYEREVALKYQPCVQIVSTTVNSFTYDITVNY